MNDHTTMWNDAFNEIFRDAVARYHENNRNVETFFTDKEFAFLASIGLKPRDLFNYVEDYANEGEPSPSTVLLITAVRRDYFVAIQHKKHAIEPMLMASDLPTPGDKLSGIAYLPRIIMKAQAWMRGALPPDVMYCCSLDREFLTEHGHINPADFLRVVWAAGNEPEKVAAFVMASKKGE